MKHKSRILLRSYRAALERYLKQGAAAGLRPASRLGRRAVAVGLQTLDLALIHEQALIAQVLSVGTTADRDRIVKRARAFFAEAIVPMEATHRSAQEANVHLSRLNRALNQRTRDLAASSRRLRAEITRRQVVVKTLRQSECHSSRLLEESRRLQKQLRHLSRRVLSAQEEERKRISRELHDVIAQVLTGINVRLAVLKAEATTSSKGLTKSIARTQRLVEKSVNIVHRFAYDLRPAVLDFLGLIPALQAFAEKFSSETGIRVSLTAFKGVEELSNAKRTALYRVAQEALTNVARHAQAGRVQVSIGRLPNAVGMDISDNGIGFEPKRVLVASRYARLGLLGIRERVEMVGGTFRVESSPGNGTTVKVQMPLRAGTKDHARP